MSSFLIFYYCNIKLCFVSLLFTMFIFIKPFVSAGFLAGSVYISLSADYASALYYNVNALIPRAFSEPTGYAFFGIRTTVCESFLLWLRDTLCFLHSPFTLWGELFSYIIQVESYRSDKLYFSLQNTATFF